MNSDQLKGKWTQFKGDLKKKWGKFTDDDLLQIQGDYDKLAGKAQERYGDKKADVLKWSESWFNERRPKAGVGSRPSGVSAGIGEDEDEA